MEKIELLTDRDTSRPPNYPLYCAHFLEVAKPIDAFIAERNRQAMAIAQSMDSNEAKIIAGRSSVSHLINLLGGIKDPIKNLGLSFSSAILPKHKVAEMKAAHIITQADERAKFLLPQIGEERVALLLPQQLRTEDAAAFMYQGKHYSLQTAINASLQLSIQ